MEEFVVEANLEPQFVSPLQTEVALSFTRSKHQQISIAQLVDYEDDPFTVSF